MANAILSESKLLHNELVELASRSIQNGTFPEYQRYIDFLNCFTRLFYQSIKDDYYWQYCSFGVYKKTLEKRFESEQSKFPDITLNEFLQTEFEEINSYYQQKGKYIEDSLPWKDVIVEIEEGYRFDFKTKYGSEFALVQKANNTINKNIAHSITKKLDYLKSKIEPVKEDIEVKPEEPKIILDYSNNKQAERIVFLHELGILDYLEDRMAKEHMGFSANKLSEILTTFTGIDKGYVQSMLNPIYSKRANQKNNPITEDSLQKVREKLINIGFTNLKTD